MNQASLPPVASPQMLVDTSGAAIQPPVLPSPGTLQAPDVAPPAPGGEPFAGGSPVGSLTATPRQAAADLLNSGERSKGIEATEGDIKADEQTQIADKQAAAAAEKTQQAADFQGLLAQSNQKYEEEHAQTQAAYDKYKAAAGSLKDPESQFYEDKGQGYRVQTALAAFASGLGAGFNGQAGNPVLDLLQKKIQANYESHKQNIQDLYNEGVQAGKIEDTSENHAKFMQDAKLRSYELQSAHVKDELASIAARAQSPLAKTAAAKTIEQIEQNQIGVKQALAQKEAAAGAAGLAAQRARQKEIRDAFKDAYDKNIAKDATPEEASQAATKLVHSLGYNASETAPIFAANGVQTDPKTGEPVFPAAPVAAAEPSEPTYDADGKLVVPTHTAAGKRLDAKEIQAATEAARDRTVVVNGTPKLAVSKEAAKAFATVQEALPKGDRLIKILQASWLNGDKGAYDRARNDMIELFPKLYGFTRGPSAAQAGESGAHDGGDPKGTVSGQIPEFEVAHRFGIPGLPVSQFEQGHIHNANLFGAANSDAGVALAKLKGLEQSLKSLKEDAFKAAFPETRAEKRAESIAKAPVADLAVSLGLKPVKR